MESLGKFGHCITYDRSVFFSPKQQKGESVESFCGRLIEQAENCDKKTTVIRDKLTLIMLDQQNELLKQTVKPTKALEILIHMDIGAQNQKKINHNHNNSNTQSVNIGNNYQNRTTNFQRQRQRDNHNANALQTVEFPITSQRSAEIPNSQRPKAHN